MVDGKQDIVCGSPNCYNGSAQFFQLQHPPHHREESGTGVEYSSMYQSQELSIDPSPRCLPLHTTLTLRESIVAKLSGKKMQEILRVAQKTTYKIEMKKVSRMVIGLHHPKKQFFWSHINRKESLRLFCGPKRSLLMRLREAMSNIC